jgi:hypothetical protein
MLRPRVLLSYSTHQATVVSGPLVRWYGPTLAETRVAVPVTRATVATAPAPVDDIPAIPARVAMGAGPAPLEIQQPQYARVEYSYAAPETHPVASTMLVPQPLAPLGMAR